MESLNNEQIFVILIFLLLVISLVLYLRKILSYNQLYDRYSGIINIEKEIEKQKLQHSELKNKYNDMLQEYKYKYSSLKTDYEKKRNIYEQLLEEIRMVEEDLDFTTYGIYKPHFDFDTSTKYKIRMETIRTEKVQVNEKCYIHNSTNKKTCQFATFLNL